jgi:hypothetical protein
MSGHARKKTHSLDGRTGFCSGALIVGGVLVLLKALKLA